MQKPRSYSHDYQNPPENTLSRHEKPRNKEPLQKKYISPMYSTNDAWLPKIDSAMTNIESPQIDSEDLK